MPSIRRHIITGDPIIHAPERAGRPNAFGGEGGIVCPFCPGNESMTPPEIARVGDPWRVRVFPNKYPAVDGHEVIVESPDHDAAFDTLSDAQEIVDVWRRRYQAHSDAAWVALFTNHGRAAGASIDHLHSQLMPLPFVPPRIEREMEAFRQHPGCPLCDTDRGLVLDQMDGFERITPHGASHAYEQWIVPVEHRPDVFGPGFAAALQRAVRAVRAVSGAHNVVLMNFRDVEKAHGYAMVIPRLSALAGFELGTGTFIDIIDPAAAVRALR